MATVPFVQQNIVIGRKLHFSFSISLFRAIAPTLYFHCKHFTPLRIVENSILTEVPKSVSELYRTVCTCDQNILYQSVVANKQRYNIL